MIGILGAMNVEIEAIRALLENRRDCEHSGILFSEGTISGVPCTVAVCGIGKVFAALCAEAMILTWHPDLLLNVGVGGAISPSLHVGSIAVADGVAQHDMDTSPLGDPIGYLSGIDRVVLPADPRAAEQLYRATRAVGIHAERGIIVSGDQFINSREKKTWLREHFTAIACEMEGAAIGQTAYVNRVPFAVLRAISDSADDSSHMDYPSFTQLAAANSVKVLRAFLKEASWIS